MAKQASSRDLEARSRTSRYSLQLRGPAQSTPDEKGSAGARPRTRSSTM